MDTLTKDWWVPLGRVGVRGGCTDLQRDEKTNYQMRIRQHTSRSEYVSFLIIGWQEWRCQGHKSTVFWWYHWLYAAAWWNKYSHPDTCEDLENGIDSAFIISPDLSTWTKCFFITNLVSWICYYGTPLVYSWQIFDRFLNDNNKHILYTTITMVAPSVENMSHPPFSFTNTLSVPDNNLLVNHDANNSSHAVKSHHSQRSTDT